MKHDDLISRLTDEQMEKVSGGSSGIHVDYYEENGYCPFCTDYHEIIHCQESLCLDTGDFPLQYCPIRGRYFFEASNGYFDWDCNMIWGWY